MDDQVEDIVAFGGGIFGMAAGVLIESCPVHKKGIGGPAVRNQSFEDIAQHLLHRQIDPPVRGEDETVLVLQAKNPLSHRTGGYHKGLKTEYTADRSSSTEGQDPSISGTYARICFVSAGVYRRNFRLSLVRSSTATSRLSRDSFWFPVCSNAPIQRVRAVLRSGSCAGTFSFNAACTASDLPPMTANCRSSIMLPSKEIRYISLLW